MFWCFLLILQNIQMIKQYEDSGATRSIEYMSFSYTYWEQIDKIRIAKMQEKSECLLFVKPLSSCRRF